MEIKFEFKISSEWMDSIAFYANDVPIGILSKIGGKILNWHPGLDPEDLRFSIQNEEIFGRITDELKAYKKENGYNDIVISEYNYGIATFFSYDVLAKHGFVNREDSSPSLYYLSE